MKLGRRSLPPADYTIGACGIEKRVAPTIGFNTPSMSKFLNRVSHFCSSAVQAKSSQSLRARNGRSTRQEPESNRIACDSRPKTPQLSSSTPLRSESRKSGNRTRAGAFHLNEARPGRRRSKIARLDQNRAIEMHGSRLSAWAASSTSRAEALNVRVAFSGERFDACVERVHCRRSLRNPSNQAQHLIQRKAATATIFMLYLAILGTRVNRRGWRAALDRTLRTLRSGAALRLEIRGSRARRAKRSPTITRRGPGFLDRLIQGI